MSTLPISSEHLTQLKIFIELCTKQPSIINHPQLSFFKTFIEKLGGKVPKQDTQNEQSCPSFHSQPTAESQEPESEESDIELDMTGVIEPDNDPPQPMGDYDLQPTVEQVEESFEKRSEAVSAFCEKDYEKSIKLYTEAILLNPQASVLYAKRGQAYSLINKVNACIRDCNRAIELNPDSAAAHKFRGRAYQLLGKWEEAATDLRKACKFDFDKEADEWLKEVTPNARKIEEHNRKKERKVLDRQERDKQERLRQVLEAQAKAREQSTKQQAQSGMPETETGGNMPQFMQFLQDPDVMAAFRDPEVSEAFGDISSNPSNIFKYQSNPKIMSLVNKMASKYGGASGLSGMMGGLGGMMGGLGGMMGGGMPGQGGVGPGGTGPAPPTDDFGLD